MTLPTLRALRAAGDRLAVAVMASVEAADAVAEWGAVANAVPVDADAPGQTFDSPDDIAAMMLDDAKRREAELADRALAAERRADALTRRVEELNATVTRLRYAAMPADNAPPMPTPDPAPLDPPASAPTGDAVAPVDGWADAFPLEGPARFVLRDKWVATSLTRRVVDALLEAGNARISRSVLLEVLGTTRVTLSHQLLAIGTELRPYGMGIQRFDTPVIAYRIARKVTGSGDGGS